MHRICNPERRVHVSLEPLNGCVAQLGEHSFDKAAVVGSSPTVSTFMEGYDPTDTNIDHALSWDEWKGSGFYVIKGEKAACFSPDGKALFLPSQVNQKDKYRSNSTTSKGRHHPAETFWEQSANRAQAKGTPWGVVEDFDSFVREAGRLPDLSNRPRFVINDPLEMHFMNVADKHGILDSVLDGDYEDDYY